ncbi:MAG: oligosaccharide flippase family protein [Candidatus Competibacteraceae bacterium]|nr:oligosaccharide flippase family protein [Candidatus Competibacteraceae bacterium]
MNRNIAVGIIFSVFLNLIVKSVWILGIELGVQRAVGNEMYGTYYGLFSFSMLFLIVLDLGITQYNTRNIARDPSLFSSQLFNLSVLKFMLGILYFLILIIAGFFSAYFNQWMYVLILLGIANFFNSFTLYFRSNMNALFHFKTDAIFSIADRALLIIFCGIALTGWINASMNIELFAWMQFASSAIVATVACIVNVQLAKKPAIQFNILLMKSTLIAGIPFALLHLVMSLYTRTDVVLMHFLIEDASTQSGIYAASYRLFDAFSQFTIIASGIMFPFFARSIKANEPVQALFGFILRNLIALSFIISTACLFFATGISSMLFNDDVAETAINLRILIWISIPYSISIISGAYITARGHMRLLITTGLIAWIINFSCNLWLIPLMGANGAAIVAFITQTVSASILLFACFRFITFTHVSKHLIRMTILSAVCLLTGWLSCQLPFTEKFQLLIFIISSMFYWTIHIFPERHIFQNVLASKSN